MHRFRFQAVTFGVALAMVVAIGAQPAGAHPAGAQPAGDGVVMSGGCKPKKKARRLIQDLRQELAGVENQIRNHPYVAAVENGEAEVCYSDPGGEPAVTVRAESAAFVDWHRGALEWHQALRSGRVEVLGDRVLARQLPTWNLRAAQVATPA